MLPAPHRLRASDEFRSVVRGGVRVGRRTLVVHAIGKQSPPSRAGFVVSKAVGNAVTRNRVKRRLRHMVAGVLTTSPIPVDVVVRALPDAAHGPLADDFASAWQTALTRLGAAA
ncbi:MAG: ribonuclease P protein component [Propioniciclava sp.]|uniref:ribonuclease P protein component n=1 Tax=Propioniciclava sp. TaxID=2038686 RepID=UPI0039E2E63F